MHEKEKANREKKRKTCGAFTQGDCWFLLGIHWPNCKHDTIFLTLLIWKSTDIGPGELNIDKRILLQDLTYI